MTLLCDALGVRPGDVVAFVGGGGKTTSMIRLAAELAATGRGVVMATTTHIREPLLSEARAILLEPDPDRLLSAVPGLVKRFGIVAAGPALTPPEADGYRRLQGLDPDLVGRIAALPGVDNVLVEADGAKGRPLKAPAAHEPVVPASTTLLVPVAGADVVGLPLDAISVHRPEIVAGLAGLTPGRPVTAEAVAAVLASPLGGLKGRPPAARVAPIINKADSPALKQRALAIALRVAERGCVERVVIGAVADRAAELTVLAGRHGGGPVARETARVAAIVLAAGAGRRFGGCKQLALAGGRPMVAYAVAAAQESSADEVVVVLGSHAAEVARALPPGRALPVVNDGWEEGMASSIRRGLAEVAARADAALFVLADQVRLTSSAVDAVVSSYHQARAAGGAARIFVPVYRGRRGNPVLFDRAYFAELLELSADEGGRALLARHATDVVQVPVESDGVVTDVDYAGDLPAALESGAAETSSDG